MSTLRLVVAVVVLWNAASAHADVHDTESDCLEFAMKWKDHMYGIVDETGKAIENDVEIPPKAGALDNSEKMRRIVTAWEHVTGCAQEESIPKELKERILTQAGITYYGEFLSALRTSSEETNIEKSEANEALTYAGILRMFLLERVLPEIAVFRFGSKKMRRRRR